MLHTLYFLTLKIPIISEISSVFRWMGKWSCGNFSFKKWTKSNSFFLDANFNSWSLREYIEA